MQKLILTYNIGEGEPCGSYLVVIPLEYESVEQWGIDFEKQYAQAFADQRNPEISDPDFLFPGAVEKVSIHNFIWTLHPWETGKAKIIESLEEFMQVNNMQIAELDVWFEYNNGKLV